MVPVGRKPFLEHQILHLRNQGIEEILLLVGYRSEQIKDFFGDGSSYAVRISYSHEEAPRGTGGALRLAQPKLQSNFLLLNGDTYLPMIYRDVINCFQASRRWGLVVVYKSEDIHSKPNLAVSSDMQVIDSDPRCRHLFPKLIARKSLWAYETNIPYYDMGTHEGLKRLEAFIDSDAASHSELFRSKP